MIFKRSPNSIFICFILSLILLFSSVQAQSQNKTKDYKISAQWQPVQNNYEGKSQSLSVLSISNESSEDLPSNGWILYFNYSGELPKPDSRGLTISFVNGDLYKIEPNAASDGIAAGAKIDFQLVSLGNIENVTQLPQGFYLVIFGDP
jgi:hexosaminidase